MRRLITLVMLGFLLWLQAELWFGRYGLQRREELQQQVEQQGERNAFARERNAQLDAELRDLKAGNLNTIEEIARQELGMIRPNEILVQFAPPPSAASAAHPAKAERLR